MKKTTVKEKLKKEQRKITDAITEGYMDVLTSDRGRRALEWQLAFLSFSFIALEIVIITVMIIYGAWYLGLLIFVLGIFGMNFCKNYWNMFLKFRYMTWRAKKQPKEKQGSER